jgi:hypothetical protein
MGLASGISVRGVAAVACVLGALMALPSLPAHGSPRDGKGAHAKKKKGKRPRTVAKKPPPPPPPPLEGTSYDFDYDGRDVGHPERAWLGRVFVHKKAAATAGQSLPVLVFLHGTNAEGIKYRWMGGGQEGDLRRMISEMIEAGQVPPMLVAAPSSIDPNTITNAMTSWPAFDLDVFLDRAAARLGNAAVLDRGRVIVAGHSGGGCNPKGGLVAALRAKGTPVLGGMSIDTCMLTDEAYALVHLRPTTHVVVSWQSISWDSRAFADYKGLFKRELKKNPAPPGVLRELVFEQPTVGMPHDAMVGISLKKWLPKLLGPGTPPVPEPAAAAGADAGAGG